jgi:DNA/RNA endonuclease G (NUC1)
MTNILPHTAQLNRGVWLRTAELAECYQDQTGLLVPG